MEIMAHQVVLVAKANGAFLANLERKDHVAPSL